MADAISLLEDYIIEGFIDDDGRRIGSSFFGYAIRGTGADLPGLRQDGVEWAIPAVGDNDARLRVFQVLQAAGFCVPVVIHPSAVVSSSAQVRSGTFVAAGAVINPSSDIGSACIINTGATVDHDCEIGDGAHIAPGANLCGGVHVGELTLVGVGASVLPCVRIGRACRVGAGAAVTHDIPDGVTVTGVPARPA